MVEASNVNNVTVLRKTPEKTTGNMVLLLLIFVGIYWKVLSFSLLHREASCCVGMVKIRYCRVLLHHNYITAFVIYEIKIRKHNYNICIVCCTVSFNGHSGHNNPLLVSMRKSINILFILFMNSYHFH